MHSHAEVWIPNNQNVEEQVRGVMEPYYKGEGENEEGFWDWYQIGGRWKGTHIPDYNPDEDPEHMITCRMCGGTGARNDVKDSPKEEIWEGVFGVKCNVCDGNGIELQWPTEWEPHPKDVIPIGEIPEEFSCSTLVLPDEVLNNFFQRRVKEALEKKGIIKGYLVTIDYHC